MKHPSDQNKSTPPQALILCSIIFLGIFLLLLAIVGASQQYGLFELLSTATKQLYLMHYSNFNEFRSGSIESVNVMTALQKIILVSLLTTTFIMAFFLKMFAPRWHLQTHQAITACWITVLLFFALCLQLKRFESFLSERKQFAGQDLKNRIASIMGTTYTFSYGCNERLKKSVNVEFITDASMDKDPYMTHQRGLAYYLYPKISLRLPTEGEVDGLLYFYKEKVHNVIPKDYDTVCQSSQMEYVLAIKRSKWDEYVNH